MAEMSSAGGNNPVERHGRKIAIAVLSVLAVAVVAVIIWAPSVASWIRGELGTTGASPNSSAPMEGSVTPLPPLSAAERKQAGALFVRDCVSCHGDRGDGISHVSRTLHPKPFDLRSFEFSSAYILHILDDGIPGTDMPAWHAASPGDLRLEAAYTASLGVPDHLSAEERYAPPEALAEAGRRVYLMHCARCHGDRGDGKGPEAEQHKPLPRSFLEIRPSFAVARKILRNGVAGTDMPAWPLLTPGEIQAVTYYIRSLYAGPEGTAVETRLPDRAGHRANEATGSEWPELDFSGIPAGPRGESIRLGMQVFLETPKYAPEYVGNQLSCGDCHLQGATAAYGVPLVGAPSWFPSYSQRAGRQISLKDRIQECFVRSESGRPLPYDSRKMNGLVAFMEWISEGKPPARPSTGRGLVKLPALQGDAARGAKIFTQDCQGCHGADGAGVPPIIPPLWGPGAYNVGAGMNRVGKMAAFVRHNMPQNHPRSLTAQQAYDVAAYVASKPHVPFNRAYAKY
jgi:thiosulfate dehydrogenase